MPSNLQRGIVAENSVRLGDSLFKASEQKLDNQSTQYGKTRVHRNESNLNDLDPDKGVQSADTLNGCHRECEGKWPGDGWWATAERNNCKWWCHLRDTHGEFRSDSQESTPTDISDTLRGIGDNFHALADSFSVL